MKKVKQFMNGIKKGTTSFGQNISTIVNSILLTVVYVVGVGVTSIFAKVAGKRFLDKELSKNNETYWSNLDLKKKPIEKYYRQF